MSDDEEEEDDVIALADDKYRPQSLEKMITLIALLVEKSRGDDNQLQLKRRDLNAILSGKVSLYKNDYWRLIILQHTWLTLCPKLLAQFAGRCLRRVCLVPISEHFCLYCVRLLNPFNQKNRNICCVHFLLDS